MDFPSDLRYTSEHEWARLGADGTVVMGITDFAQDALGDIVYVELAEAGTRVDKGGMLGEVESTKSTSEIYAPCTGEVLETNAALSSAPERVNAEPYGDGWMARLRCDDPAEIESLMDAGAYRAMVDST